MLSVEMQKIVGFCITCALLFTVPTLAKPKEPEKADRHLPQSSCSKLQYEIQSAILANEWGLQNLKFQQRLKRHPQYIVTIQHIRSTHDPLIELRCPGGHAHGAGAGGDLNHSHSDKLEIYFHESRFSAESVRLFDINSIFPIHSGSLSVKIKLEPLVIIMEKGTDLGRGIQEIYWKRLGLLGGGDELSHSRGEVAVANKEHRESENEESLLDLEREIEGVFTRRIQPDVKKQIENLVKTTTGQFLSNNLVRFV